MYKVVDGQMTRQEIQEFKFQHEEADTRIDLYVKYAWEQIVLPNTVVRCIDTDVLVILLFIWQILKALFGWMLGMKETTLVGMLMLYSHVEHWVEGYIPHNLLSITLLGVTLQLPFFVKAKRARWIYLRRHISS